MTPAKLRKLLTTKFTVDASVVAQALGVGKDAINNAIDRGAIPVVDLGEGAKRKPILTSWVRQQLRMEDEKSRP